LSVCETYNKNVNLKVVLSGSSEADCKLLAAFNNATQDTSLPLTQRQQLKEMKDKIQLSFNGTVDLTVRMKFMSVTCYNASQMMPWLVEVFEMLSCDEDLEMSVYDIIFCSGICTNNGCSNPNQGPGPNQASSSVAPPTSPAVSSAAPPTSSAAPSTSARSTTQMPADCSKVGSLIQRDGNNKTVLTTVLDNNYTTWNATMKMGFNSCFNSIRQAIWDDTTYPSPSSKLSKCKTSFLQYNANNPSKQAVVLDIQISIWAGTIRQFCNCIS